MGYAEKLDKLLTQEQVLRQEKQAEIVKCQKKMDVVMEDMAVAKKSRALIQKVAMATQAKLQYHINNLVSNAFATLWDDPFTFELRFVEKRNRTEAELWFKRGGYDYMPLTSGGGELDIASFALRLGFWGLDGSAQVIMLDEPSKHLSADKQERYCELLKEVQRQLNIQFIIVTHIQKLQQTADTLIHVSAGNII